MRSAVVSYENDGGIGIHGGCGPGRANTRGSHFVRRTAVSGLHRGLPRAMRALSRPLRHAFWRSRPASAAQPPRITPVTAMPLQRAIHPRLGLSNADRHFPPGLAMDAFPAMRRSPRSRTPAPCHRDDGTFVVVMCTVVTKCTMHLKRKVVACYERCNAIMGPAHRNCLHRFRQSNTCPPVPARL